MCTGPTGGAPATYMRNAWLNEVMQGALGCDKNTTYKTYCEQLDEFVRKIGWPERARDEKENKLAKPEICEFLLGIQAVLELYFYGLPDGTVCSLVAFFCWLRLTSSRRCCSVYFVVGLFHVRNAFHPKS